MSCKSLAGAILYLSAGILYLHCAPPVWQKVDMAKRQGNLDAAISQINEHLVRHSQDAKALFALGELYAETDRWQEMQQALAACVQADAGWERETRSAREYHWTTNLNAGLAELQAAEVEKARQHFHNCTLILPERSLTHRLYAEATLTLSDSALAQASLVKALELDPIDHRARRFLISLYFAKGNYLSAIREADLLLQVFPRLREAQRVKAYSYDRLDDRSQALAAYQQLTSASGSPGDLEAFAAFEYRYADYEQSARLSRLAILRGGDRLQNLKAVAQCQLMQLNYRGLGDTARQILELNKIDLVGLQLLELSYAGLGASEAASSIHGQIEQQTHK